VGGCQLVGERSKQKEQCSYFRNVQPAERKEIKCSRRKEKKSNGLNVIRNFIAKEVKQGMIRDIENVQVSSNQQRKRKSQRKL
jgi:hypothetical protein